MKAIVGSAVFGLLPVPTLPAAYSRIEDHGHACRAAEEPTFLLHALAMPTGVREERPLGSARRCCASRSGIQSSIRLIIK